MRFALLPRRSLCGASTVLREVRHVVKMLFSSLRFFSARPPSPPPPPQRQAAFSSRPASAVCRPLCLSKLPDIVRNGDAAHGCVYTAAAISWERLSRRTVWGISEGKKREEKAARRANSSWRRGKCSNFSQRPRRSSWVVG